MSKSNHMPSVSPQVHFYQWVQGWATLMLCHNLVKTGVFEQMAAGARSLDELAEACHLNRSVLYRVLRMSNTLDLTTSDNDRYALSDLGRMMLKDTPGTLYNGILLAGLEGYQRPWQNFAYSLTTGESAFTHVMGVPFFDYLEQSPEYRIPFQQQMTLYATMTDPTLVSAYDFSPYLTVCDVGGGEGSFLMKVLQANPHLRGVLFDLPRVVENPSLGEMAGRVEVVAGNFFERVPSADLLVLKTVLHDWSDEKCAVILDRCRQAMLPESRLLIIDRILEEPVDVMSAFYDLHMLVQIGGRERTAAEFNVLLHSAGFQIQRVIVPGESPLFPLRLVEAALQV